LANKENPTDHNTRKNRNKKKGSDKTSANCMTAKKGQMSKLKGGRRKGEGRKMPLARRGLIKKTANQRRKHRRYKTKKTSVGEGGQVQGFGSQYPPRKFKRKEDGTTEKKYIRLGASSSSRLGGKWFGH